MEERKEGSVMGWDSDYYGPYGPYDDEDDDCEECEECEDDPLGCLYPGRCIMTGTHLESECATAEMMAEIDQNYGTN